MIKKDKIETKIDDVRIFWNNHPCGSDYSLAQDRKKYFEEIESHRYTKIRSIKEIADFDKYKGKKVLEVGCGVGTDGKQFVKYGAIYFGINLDEASTNYAKENFALMGIKGEICQMDAEKMKFADMTFDHIYSLGVLHHSPNTEEIAREMFRVIKPGGTISVMIYNKTSINYYLNIMFLRKLFRLALYPKSAPNFFSKIMGYEIEKNREILEKHRQIMLGEKMTKEMWISKNTDGPDCPLSKVYNKTQATKLFEQAGFVDIKNHVRYFNKQHYGYLGKLIPNFVADKIGNVAGWHRWIKATKPIN